MPGIFFGAGRGGGGGGSSFFLGTAMGPISPCGPPASGGACSVGFCCCWLELWSWDCAPASARLVSSRQRTANRLTAGRAGLCPGEQDDGRLNMNPSRRDFLCASIDAL